MKKNIDLAALWLLFFLFVFIRITNMMTLWPVLALWSAGLSVSLLIRAKLPTAKGIIGSVILAAAVMLSVVFGLGADGVTMFYGAISAVSTLLASLAVFSVAGRRGDVRFVNRSKKLSPLWSALIAVGAGAVLAVVNYYLTRRSGEIPAVAGNPRYALYTLAALCPAICEETAQRAVFMAFCLYGAKDGKPGFFRLLTMWVMMTLPHAISHGYDLSWTLLLTVLFGVPFALLQRKRDVASAMIAHGIVDAVRIFVFGPGGLF